MDDTNSTVIEYYIKHNLPQNYNLEYISSIISELLDENERVVYYIPGNRITSAIIFTTIKIIVAQRFDGEWGGDLIVPYKEISRFKIKRQNKLFFIFKLDLIVEFEGIIFYVKKSQAYNFRKLMWDIFEIK
jgi:hypothetical protein